MHCPENYLNLSIQLQPVKDGADAKVRENVWLKNYTTPSTPCLFIVQRFRLILGQCVEGGGNRNYTTPSTPCLFIVQGCRLILGHVRLEKLKFKNLKKFKNPFFCWTVNSLRFVIQPL